MFNVIECTTGQHDMRLVFLAAGVCLLGNIGVFVLLNRSTLCMERRRQDWLMVAAVAEGIGVWATHFVAMLAYRGPMPIEFGMSMTLLSVAIAIGFFWGVFHWLGTTPDFVRSMQAGAGAAIGIHGMHFTGMAAIIAPARISYAITPVLISLGLSALLFGAAFVVFANFEGRRRIILPAVLAVCSIVVLHFTAMSATTLTPDPARVVSSVAILRREWLIPAIILANLLLLALALTGSFVDRWLTDARGLAEATLEGLAIVSEGRIVEVNRQLSRLFGTNTGKLVGSAPSDWLVSIAGDRFEMEQDRPVEARVCGSADEDQIIEIATQAIEYRGRRCEVLAVRDLSESKRAQRAIEHLASHDPLTDLANRAFFMRALDGAIVAGEPFALLALDLDRFKAINDIFGHSAGDDILRRVADILRASVRRDDIVARVGGDEFLILQRPISGPSDTGQLARRVLENFAIEMDITRDPMSVAVSIGAVLYPQDGRDAETLQKNADIALYWSKNNERGTAVFFNPGMDGVARERRALEHDLRQAIARNQLRLVFQPIVATASGSVVAYEALLRWQHATRGEISPDRFIPVAEEIGAIVPIGEWVLHQACATAATWPQHIAIAVNVSTVQFQLPNLPVVVREALEKSGLEAQRLELEITETALVRNRQAALRSLHEIRAMGVRIAMDDFGTGYSSLSNLKAFPFDKIKIDKTFISTILDDEAARSIVRAIVSLGRSFNMPIIAEGVETEAQRQLLLEEGCSQAQGFFFGWPACDPFAAAEFPTLRASGKRTSSSGSTG